MKESIILIHLDSFKFVNLEAVTVAVTVCVNVFEGSQKAPRPASRGG